MNIWMVLWMLWNYTIETCLKHCRIQSYAQTQVTNMEYPIRNLSDMSRSRCFRYSLRHRKKSLHENWRKQRKRPIIFHIPFDAHTALVKKIKIFGVCSRQTCNIQMYVLAAICTVNTRFSLFHTDSSLCFLYFSTLFLLYTRFSLHNFLLRFLKLFLSTFFR